MNSDIKELIHTMSDVFKGIHQRSYHKAENKHIYPGQPRFLSLIKENEGITQKELAEKNCVTPASVTGMLGKLEANHLIYRLPDEADKRILRVYLTPEGREFTEHAESFMQDMIEQIFHDFTDEELHTLLLLSQKMRNNLWANEK